MLNAVIRFALRQRLLILAASLFLLGYGTWETARMEIDVFPNLNRPRVVVMTEAPGMSPEEVESLITFPLETAINGANGVMAVRSSSGVGISVIYVEFDWKTDIYIDRQIVNERLAMVADRMPRGVQPTLAPISSIMGQILMVGMWSYEDEKNDKTLVGRLAAPWQTDLDRGAVSDPLRAALQPHVGEVSAKARLQPPLKAVRWIVVDSSSGRTFPIRREDTALSVRCEVTDKDGKPRLRFPTIDLALADELDQRHVPEALRAALADVGVKLSDLRVTVQPQPVRWLLRDEERNRLYVIRKEPGESDLQLHRLTSDLDLRTLADWSVRQRLLTIPGVAQVFTMGGGRKQFQVLIDPDALLRFGVTLEQVRVAMEGANENATGGYLDEQGPNEWLVRSLGRVQSISDLEMLPVALRDGRPVTLRQIARIVEGPQVKRGDSSAFVRQEDGSFSGGPAVVLTINKQPGADTRRVTDAILTALGDVKLPADVQVQPEVYSQRSFIDRAIHNVVEALWIGGLLVVIILFLFLLNFRTTFITLTAIPLSLVMTAVVFAVFNLSINTMTLGGLAVAIGELVDDAIVDVENIFRRLRENRHAAQPKHPLVVIYQASVEVRNSIVFSTMIVVLVFIPLFALGGMEGRLFAPLGVAYIVSIVASLLVSLTVTPVLSYWLLVDNRAWRWLSLLISLAACIGLAWWLMPGPPWLRLAVGAAASLLLWLVMTRLDSGAESEHDSWVLRQLKGVAAGIIRFSLRYSSAVFIAATAAVAVAAGALWLLERDFLPPFNEGAVQLNVVLQPGTSLKKSNEIAATVEQRLMQVPEILSFARRTGRAELDEHAEGVNMSEFIIDLDPASRRSRQTIIDEIREAMADIPGIASDVEQPLAHLISHMISGVKAQVGIKLYGDDLVTLRSKAAEMQAAIRSVPGVEDLRDEKQVEIPQLQLRLKRPQLERYGITPRYVNEHVQTAMNGLVVSQVLMDQSQQTFDLVLRMDDRFRENRETLRRLAIELPHGGTVPLASVADIQESSGPNTINREQVKRRIVLQCNVAGRGLVDVVEEIKQRLEPIKATLPDGYFIEYGGQFESQQEASRTIGYLFIVSLLGMFLVLYTLFRSVNLSLQVMAALPMAFIGSVAALWLTGQTLTIAAMVGFISMAGIATRNGILLINHYLHLVRYEGENFTQDMVVRGSLERLAPVLMTALTAGIGLVPLALAAGEPGKEILYPVATVIIGGLISSTALEYFVHPALFWTLGRRSAEQLQTEHLTEPALKTEIE